MEAPARILEWGFIQLSVPNLIVIGLMIAVFVLALVIPFPSHGGSEDDSR